MIDQEQQVCEGCHARPAIHHIHYEHTGKARRSCQVCYDQFPSPEELAYIIRDIRSVRRKKPGGLRSVSRRRSAV